MQVTFITGRNEVVAKVMFLQLCVILFTGGGLPQCMLGYHPLPRRHPPQKGGIPLQGDPPRRTGFPLFLSRKIP